MVQVTQVRCEYQQNPIGIGEREPRLSWKLEALAGERGVTQSAYEIQVAEDAAFGLKVWESGKVTSDQSIHVETKGLISDACKRYYYRVRVWDRNDLESDWSETSFYETGKLRGDRWQGEWITAPLSQLPADAEQAPLLRKSFALSGPVKQARIYATALGIYELELNGKRVGDSYFAPGWTSYGHILQTQTYDVTGLVAPGDNAIGAWLGNGWYKGYLAWQDQKAVYGDRLALLMELHVEYEDGGRTVIASDGSWTSAPGPIKMAELYHGETYDARDEMNGWSTAAFAETGEWRSVERIERGFDLLTPQINEPVRKIQTLKPVGWLTTPKGETVIDFGQNLVGWVKFSISGAAGSEVSISHAEVLDADGNFYTDNLRSAKQKIRYTMRGEGIETYQPRFTFQGFRYVRLEGFMTPYDPEAFEAVVLHSDMEETGSFACSNPLINQLQSNIRWGLKGNFLDVPTDCPQRDERLGWTGDAQMFVQTAAYLANVAPFFTKWLGDLATDQREDGAVPFVVPHVLDKGSYASAAWGDAAVICPWTIYACYGDKRILESQYESMASWISYIRAQGDQPYLWNTGFHFGDWLGLDAKSGDYVGATDRDLIASAFYAYSVTLMRKTAEVLGRSEDAEAYAELQERVIAAFREEFVTPGGRLSSSTQTGHVLALMFELLDGPSEKRAAKRLKELLETSKHHLTTGFVGTPYISHVLSKHGMLDDAYKLLLQQDLPSWLYPVTKGATTIWEHWDGIKEDGSFWSSEMNSFNHYAYGAIGDWLYRTVAGIQPVESAPGYKKFVVAPQPGGELTWAEGSIETMYGAVRSAWKISGEGRIELEVVVPPNATAEIRLPGAAKAADVEEGGLPLGKAAGVTITETDSGVTLEAGSGTYRFMYAYAKQGVSMATK
ncbi:glycoside hydrolase family 78 protein [Paenibacillus sp. LHD-117]|uniref:glycoside hydrolase family 78 protein n=1 Tax=Paenibacillus sp. LHD-117 TaxID=3071412 RepID=UPI0027E10BA8|nr:glycoside hydrolase family 78 protein [Paenibacillus sp. LHD-117]MDQ6418533.1 glycoside hydrolase family 78 protein [Paenibacillus sp. LHD-117]